MKTSNYKVLIVDDIEENLQVVGNILSEKEVAILLAKNGKQAIKVAQRKLPDLILLDINMPEMNGYQACEMIKNNEKTKDIPIIFLSALSEKDDIVKGFSIGGVDYISKPFNKTELLARVFTHLELKKAKDQLKNQNKELKELNATKDKFFSIIAHDLRSPFSSMIGFSKLLNKNFDKYDQEKQKKFINMIDNGIQNTYKLLDNLLLWARSQKGKIEFNPKEINLYSLSDETHELLNQSIENKLIQFTNQINPNISVHADNEMLSIIIRNLISNAIKFTPKEGEIIINAKENNQDFVEVSVKDTGVGIPKEVKSKIFDISENTSTQGTENETGTGLGLILCKEFVEKHGGKIWVESEEEKGSEFIFTLPQKGS